MLHGGRLAETTALVEETLRETISPVNQLHLLISLAAARLRQGDPRSETTIEQAWQLAMSNGERAWRLRVAIVAAERPRGWPAGRG